MRYLAATTMFDRYLLGKPDVHIDRRVRDGVQSGLRKAKRFVLDAEASAQVGRFVVEHREGVFDAFRNVRVPYPDLYVEMDTIAFNDAIGPISTADVTGMERDSHCGYLFTGNTVNVIAESTTKPPVLTGLAYRLNTLGQDADVDYMIERLGGKITERHLAHTLGSSINGISTKDAFELVKRHAWHLTVTGRARSEVDRDLVGYLTNSNGELRNIVSLLHLLNQERVVEERPGREVAERHLHKGKNSQFHVYRKLILHLDRVVVRTERPPEGAADRPHPRWHEVRGHWCHNRKAHEATAIGCIHDWLDLSPTSQLCNRCHGKRWWRELPNGRGDKSAGTVIKDYEVRGMSPAPVVTFEEIDEALARRRGDRA
jgi:hypothetical protein